MSSDYTAGWVEHVSERAAFLHQHIVSPAIEEYRGKPWPLISAIEDFTNQNKVPMLISRAKMEIVRDVLAEKGQKPKVILEFGAYVGNSAVGWAAILQDLNGADAEGLHVYTFEMDPKIAQCARDLVSLAGLQDVVTVLEGPGSESLKGLVAEGKVKPGEVDMVFIDHWEKHYLPDLQLCEQLKLFHKGSLAIADNTIYPGAPAYLKYVRAGGSGVAGGVRYESSALTVQREPRQSVVEVSKVVEV